MFIITVYAFSYSCSQLSFVCENIKRMTTTSLGLHTTQHLHMYSTLTKEYFINLEPVQMYLPIIMFEYRRIHKLSMEAGLKKKLLFLLSRRSCFAI